MTKIVTILFILTLSLTTFSQKELRSDLPVNNCSGAINLFENGDFKLQFTGKKSENDLSRYKALGNLSVDNMIWCAFVAPQGGKLTFKASVETDFLQMVIFAEERSSVCEDIASGIAEIKRMHVKRDVTEVGLNNEIGGGVLYTLELKEGQHIQLLFATIEENRQDLTLHWDFKPNVVVESERKIVDKRHDDFATTIAFKVIDPETKLPIISNMSIDGYKDINGLYVGSEFYFNLDRNTKLSIKCDAEGYFFHDSIYEISAFEDITISIELIRVSSGKSLCVEEIEFIPGTSEILETSFPNLRRLKDFLALNSDISVEIQGHVFALGDNSFAAQRISEARAKRVVKYLIDNGIDKDRLTAVGYGNTRPIYEKPRFYYEEQANRRVEVLIK